MSQADHKPGNQKDKEQEKPSPMKQVVQIARDSVTEMLKPGEPSSLDHMGHLHGLGLLSELASDIAGSRQAPAPAADSPHPVNPRKQVKPRAQIKPR